VLCCALQCRAGLINVMLLGLHMVLHVVAMDGE